MMKELPSPTFPISQIALPRGSLHQSLLNQNTASNSKNSKSAIEVSWAKHQDEVREAQKLRFDVFARLPDESHCLARWLWSRTQGLIGL